MQIHSETLALWFLRLNGFLTIPNFVVHPESPGGGQGTDVDVLGVRFPDRAENQQRPMRDHDLFLNEHRVQVVISEIKKNRCRLNGPWTNSERQNMQKVLFAGGFVPAADVEGVARALYEHGIWQSERMTVRILCFGGRHNRGVESDRPQVPQLLWKSEVLPFIFKRFWDYRLEKRLHDQWDPPIKELFQAAWESAGELGRFIDSVEVTDSIKEGA